MMIYHINYTSHKQDILLQATKTYDISSALYSFVAVAEIVSISAEWHGEQYLSVHEHEHEGPAIAAIAVRLNDC